MCAMPKSAIRIESSDVKSQWGNKPFVVYDGTVALVFSRGRQLGELPTRNAGQSKRQQHH